MRGLQRVVCAAALAASVVVATGRAQQAPAPPQVDPTPHPDRFVGVWKYNETDSVDAATGQPERAASARRVAPAPGAEGTAGAGSSVPQTGGYVGCMGCPGSMGGDPTAAAVMGGLGRLGAGAAGPAPITPPSPSERARTEARDLVRDLTEIPETLTIAMTAASMSLTDDLGRLLTFPIDGKKRRYHLSAVNFDASARWDGPRLVVRISGSQDFSLTETYMLNEDGQRLFVLLRLGAQAAPMSSTPATAGRATGAADAGVPDVRTVAGRQPSGSTPGAPAPTPDAAPPIGVNRAYDRLH